MEFIVPPPDCLASAEAMRQRGVAYLQPGELPVNWCTRLDAFTHEAAHFPDFAAPRLKERRRNERLRAWVIQCRLLARIGHERRASLGPLRVGSPTGPKRDADDTMAHGPQPTFSAIATAVAIAGATTRRRIAPEA